MPLRGLRQRISSRRTAQRLHDTKRALFRYGRWEEVSDADSRRLFDTNFWGVVYGSLVALPHLHTNGGALINVGSEVSDAVIPLQRMYSASKHAVKGFTDALRIEVCDLDKAGFHHPDPADRGEHAISTARA